jgi:hypothetical protein
MNYHLNQQGRHLGVFSLEELHRRRVAGELTGSELVWCEGMVQWQSLDVVLRQKLPGALRVANAPEAKPKTNALLLVFVGVMLLLFVGGLVCLGIAMVKFAPRMNHTLTAINTARTEPDAPEPSAISIASQPIIWASNTVTTAEMTVRGREFRDREYVDEYKLRGDRDTTADELSLGLVQNWVASNFGGDYDTNLPPLAELSDKLANDPDCTDPLVLTVTAVNCESAPEATRRLERAVKGFENSRHLGYPKFFATVTLASRAMQDRAARLPELDALALRRLREALADGSLQPKDQAELGEILVSGWGSAFFKRNELFVISTVQNQGRPFKWLALVLAGEHEINLAWLARGNGTADTVTAAGWQGFNLHLSRAAASLKPAWQLRPDLPLAPCRMMTVALGDSSLADMRRWFDRTLAAQVDYEPAWNSMRWGLRPRWFGSPEALLALGVTALNTRRFDTAVPQQYFNSVRDVEEDLDLPAGQHIYGRDDVWPHLQEMYEGYVAQAHNPASWRDHYAIIAYLAGQYAVAGKQLPALGWRTSDQNIWGWGRDLTLLPLEVAARTSAQSNSVSAAERSWQQQDVATALKQYRDLAADTNLDDRTQAFVLERLASLGIESRLQAHEWVDYLPADTNFTGWHVERGNCKLNADGSLSVQSGPTGHLLYCRARIGTEFEVRGQFEVERTSTKSFQAGLVMGLPQVADDYTWQAFRIKRSRAGGDVASFSRHWSRQELLNPAPLDDFTNTFYFRMKNGKVSATVNDQEVFKEIDPLQRISVNTNEFMLGLGAYNDANDTVIRYWNVQARSLAETTGFQLTTPTK